MSDDQPEHDGEEEQQPVAPAVDAEQPRRVRGRQKRELVESQNFWRAAFATEIGRREIWKVLDILHPFEQRFPCGPNGFPSHDASVAAVAEQSAGLRLFLTLQERDPEGVMLMMFENDPRFAGRPVPKITIDG